MPLILDENNAAYQIRAYTPGQIQVNQDIYTRSLIISSEKLFENWPPQHISQLEPEHFHIISELHPAIFILGTGEKLIFPKIELYGQLLNQGIGVEIMDTSAACRTYNILALEGRNVAALLII